MDTVVIMIKQSLAAQWMATGAEPGPNEQPAAAKAVAVTPAAGTPLAERRQVPLNAWQSPSTSVIAV